MWGGFVDKLAAQARLLLLQEGAAWRGGTAAPPAREQQRHGDFFKPLILWDAAALRLPRLEACDERVEIFSTLIFAR